MTGRSEELRAAAARLAAGISPDVVPEVVRGPHEFANPAVKKALGRDYIDQTEELPEVSEIPEGGAAPVAAE